MIIKYLVSIPFYCFAMYLFFKTTDLVFEYSKSDRGMSAVDWGFAFALYFQAIFSLIFGYASFLLMQGLENK